MRTVTLLSIQQPWAWLIANGYKDIENRSWSTRYRGELYIHAGKSFDTEGYAWVQFTFPALKAIIPSVTDLKGLCGGVVGKAHLTGCVTVHPSEWFFGPYGWVMAEQETTDFVPMRGQLGIFSAQLA